MSYYNVLAPATMQAETFKEPQFTSRKIQKGLGCNRRVWSPENQGSWEHQFQRECEFENRTLYPSVQTSPSRWILLYSPVFSPILDFIRSHKANSGRREICFVLCTGSNALLIQEYAERIIFNQTPGATYGSVKPTMKVTMAAWLESDRTPKFFE